MRERYEAYLDYPRFLSLSKSKSDIFFIQLSLCDEQYHPLGPFIFYSDSHRNSCAFSVARTSKYGRSETDCIR